MLVPDKKIIEVLHKMAMLNLNSKIYRMIKKDAEENKRSIHEQAVYYLLLGKVCSNFKHVSYEENEKSVFKVLNEFKTTG